MYEFFKKSAHFFVLAVMLAITLSCTNEDILNQDVTDGYTKIIEMEVHNSYLVRGWQLPGPDNLVVGAVQYAVELYQKTTMNAVGNAIVAVYATPIELEVEAVTSLALNTPINPQFYESLLELGTPGSWEIEFRIAQPINASLFTTVEVTQRNRTGTILWQGTIAFLILFVTMISLTVILFVRANRRKRQWQ